MEDNGGHALDDKERFTTHVVRWSFVSMCRHTGLSFVKLGESFTHSHIKRQLENRRNH